MPWKAHTEGEIRHVWPDDEDHNLEDTKCWCNPEVKVYEGPLIQVIHNSRDGREYIERLISKDSICKN